MSRFRSCMMTDLSIDFHPSDEKSPSSKAVTERERERETTTYTTRGKKYDGGEETPIHPSIHPSHMKRRQSKGRGRRRARHRFQIFARGAPRQTLASWKEPHLRACYYIQRIFYNILIQSVVCLALSTIDAPFQSLGLYSDISYTSASASASPPPPPPPLAPYSAREQKNGTRASGRGRGRTKTGRRPQRRE